MRLKMKKNKSIVSSLIPSTNVGVANEYGSDDTLSLRNGEYHGIFLKVEKKEVCHNSRFHSCFCVYRKTLFPYITMTHSLNSSKHESFSSVEIVRYYK